MEEEVESLAMFEHDERGTSVAKTSAEAKAVRKDEIQLGVESKREQRREKIRADERGGPWIYIPVSHFEPSAARLKFSRGRADVIKTNYAYGTVMPHHFIP